jgi:coatomer protein complex subunit alpha (xenin)
VVTHVLVGHVKGVNWVAFHPTNKSVCSGADDKTIKLWRLQNNKSWEIDTMKGHVNNVSCAIFHPRMEVLLSNSEDRTMKVWDLSRRVQIHSYRKESDRFWILATHPQLNYFAAGHDNGFLVFKLERERFASQRVGQHVFFVKNKSLYAYDLSTNDRQLLSPVNVSGKQIMNNHPKTILYNQFNTMQHDILLNFDQEGGSFVLFSFHKDIKAANNLAEKRADGILSAIFIAKDKLAVLDKNKELSVCDFDGSKVKSIPL